MINEAVSKHYFIAIMTSRFVTPFCLLATQLRGGGGGGGKGDPRMKGEKNFELNP